MNRIYLHVAPIVTDTAGSEFQLAHAGYLLPYHHTAQPPPTDFPLQKNPNKPFGNAHPLVPLIEFHTCSRSMLMIFVHKDLSPQ